jgi:Listeria-Bacteroides repeat domain (List_Bact_rpt)
MTFTVTYNGNGATGGSVPVDATAYNSGDQVTVLGNTGNLSLPGGQFAYWNTAADGSGALQGPGAKFTITSDVTLFAQWLVTDGLPNGGVTTHFAFSYDRALANPGGPEPARTSAVMATVEGDYNLMASWFGGISLTVPVPVQTHVINAGGGAHWGPPLTLEPGGGDVTLCRYLIISEVTEMFMMAQNQGWFAPNGADEQSCGEGLSRFLAQQFLVLEGLGVIESGYAVSPSWLNSALPPGTSGSTQLGPVKTTLPAAIDASVTTIPLATGLPIPPFASTWIVQIDSESMLMTAADTGNKTITVQRGYNGTTAAAHAAGANVNDNFGARADYVNVTLEYDNNIDAAIGCSMLFLYYLSVQLGFAIADIVAAAPGAGNAATCLRGVYRNLTNDSSDPFPFFKQLLDNAFPPSQVATVPGPNPDNPWPLGSLSFWGVKDTWGKDEVADIIDHSGGTYPEAFWLMLEGFNTQVAGTATPSIPAVAYAGVSTALDPAGIAYETTNPYVPQRIRYPYDVSFAPSIAFPASGETPAAVTSSISLLGTSVPADGEFFFLAGADPYFTNVQPGAGPNGTGNAPYLSADLRVFTATPSLNPHPVPGGPAFSAGAYAWIQALLGYLNQNFGDGGGPDPFDPSQNVIPGQQDALLGDSSVTPYVTTLHGRHARYSFAVARVRLRGTKGSMAEGVKVFFRLWATQTTDTLWNPSDTYLSQTDASGNPLWPLAPAGNHTIPFFATGNAPDFTDPDNPEYGASGVNNQTITIAGDDPQWAYFGCFLNVYDQSLLVNGVPVTQSLPGTHHCLVAQIAYADAPIENAGGVTISPENSDQLAQRNLQITASDNPGGPAAHRIPQTFVVRPSPPTVAGAVPGDLDELMIDWGETPAGCIARIYWPQVAAADVLALASRLYGTHALSAADPHTLQCKTVSGVTYVPVPSGTDPTLAGLFTIDLPTTVHTGQEFDIVVRKISSRRIAAAPPPPVLQAKGRRAPHRSEVVVTPARKIVIERYTAGSFRVMIPVSTAEVLLPGEEDTLAIFKARLAAMSPKNPWYPVLRRYLDYQVGRVNGLGGDASQIPPSFGGAPVGAVSGRQGVHHGSGSRAWTGKVTGLVFDHFGDFDGFVLDTGERDDRFFSREPSVRELAEVAWREHLRVTVLAEADDHSARIGSIVLHEPPG